MTTLFGPTKSRTVADALAGYLDVFGVEGLDVVAHDPSEPPGPQRTYDVVTSATLTRGEDGDPAFTDVLGRPVPYNDVRRAIVAFVAGYRYGVGDAYSAISLRHTAAYSQASGSLAHPTPRLPPEDMRAGDPDGPRVAIVVRNVTGDPTSRLWSWSVTIDGDVVGYDVADGALSAMTAARAMTLAAFVPNVARLGPEGIPTDPGDWTHDTSEGESYRWSNHR